MSQYKRLASVDNEFDSPHLVSIPLHDSQETWTRSTARPASSSSSSSKPSALQLNNRFQVLQHTESSYTRLPGDDDEESRELLQKGPSHLIPHLEITADTPMHPPARRIIKLMGSPLHPCTPHPSNLHPNTTCSITGDTSSATLSSPLPINDNYVMDTLDAYNEDPFTLESFESLIRLHTERGKDFILSRVTTMDPHDETKLYYSYYAAHHINKVIFRTQPEEGLLHRMKAKNPLNNMTIVGDVHYYVIHAASSMDKKADSPGIRQSIDSILSLFTSQPPQKDRRPSSSGTTYRHIDLESKKTSRPISAGTQTQTAQRVQRPVSAFGKLERNSHAESVTIKIAPSPTQHHQESTRPSNPLGLFLQLAGLSDASRPRPQVTKRTLHLIMRPEALDADSLDAIKTNDKLKGSRRNSLDSAITSEPKPIAPSPTHSYCEGQSYEDYDLDVLQEPHTEPIKAPRITASSTGVRANAGGTPRVHRRIRTMAFMQENTVQPVKEKNSKRKKNKKSKSSRQKIDPLDKDLERYSPNSSESSGTPGSQSSPPSPTMYYKAMYYGTDDDFLMKSSVRTYFKENALEDGDALLFTIAYVAQEQPSNLNPHPTLPQFLYQVQEEVVEGIEEDVFEVFRRLRENGRWKKYALVYIICVANTMSARQTRQTRSQAAAASSMTTGTDSKGPLPALNKHSLIASVPTRRSTQRSNPPAVMPAVPSMSVSTPSIEALPLSTPASEAMSAHPTLVALPYSVAASPAYAPNTNTPLPSAEPMVKSSWITLDELSKSTPKRGPPTGSTIRRKERKPKPSPCPSKVLMHLAPKMVETNGSCLATTCDTVSSVSLDARSVSNKTESLLELQVVLNGKKDSSLSSCRVGGFRSMPTSPIIYRAPKPVPAYLKPLDDDDDEDSGAMAPLHQPMRETSLPPLSFFKSNLDKRAQCDWTCPDPVTRLLSRVVKTDIVRPSLLKSLDKTYNTPASAKKRKRRGGDETESMSCSSKKMLLNPAPPTLPSVSSWAVELPRNYVADHAKSFAPHVPPHEALHLVPKAAEAMSASKTLALLRPALASPPMDMAAQRMIMPTPPQRFYSDKPILLPKRAIPPLVASPRQMVATPSATPMSETLNLVQEPAIVSSSVDQPMTDSPIKITSPLSSSKDLLRSTHVPQPIKKEAASFHAVLSRLQHRPVLSSRLKSSDSTDSAPMTDALPDDSMDTLEQTADECVDIQEEEPMDLLPSHPISSYQDDIPMESPLPVPKPRVQSDMDTKQDNIKTSRTSQRRAIEVSPDVIEKAMSNKDRPLREYNYYKMAAHVPDMILVKEPPTFPDTVGGETTRVLSNDAVEKELLERKMNAMWHTNEASAFKSGIREFGRCFPIVGEIALFDTSMNTVKRAVDKALYKKSASELSQASSASSLLSSSTLSLPSDVCLESGPLETPLLSMSASSSAATLPLSNSSSTLSMSHSQDDPTEYHSGIKTTADLITFYYMHKHEFKWKVKNKARPGQRRKRDKVRKMLRKLDICY